MILPAAAVGFSDQVRTRTGRVARRPLPVVSRRDQTCAGGPRFEGRAVRETKQAKSLDAAGASESRKEGGVRPWVEAGKAAGSKGFSPVGSSVFLPAESVKSLTSGVVWADELFHMASGAPITRAAIAGCGHRRVIATQTTESHWPQRLIPPL